MTFRRLITPLLAAMFIALAHHGALAQSAPAAQPPGPAGQGNGTPPSADECKNQFAPLRDEAERRGQLIKDASARHAPPDEACRLIRSYVEAEIKMVDFVETQATACAVPPSVLAQLKSSQRTTEVLQMKICGAAQQPQTRPPVGDFQPDRNGRQSF